MNSFYLGCKCISSATMMSWVNIGYLYPYIIAFVLLVQLLVQLHSEMDQWGDLPGKYSLFSPSFYHLISQLVWFFSLIMLWCSGQLCWRHCDGNKGTGKLYVGRAVPSLLVWLLHVEWQLKLLSNFFRVLKSSLLEVTKLKTLPTSLHML